MLPQEIGGGSGPGAAAHEEVTIATRFRGGVRPLTIADPDRLRAALANLVDNAVSATPAGVAVDVETSVEGDRVRIAVTDEGPGVAVEQRERIFEPYVRLAERTGGTGLGLHLARQIARAMGGELGLEPGDGPGATFVLELATARSAAGR